MSSNGGSELARYAARDDAANNAQRKTFWLPARKHLKSSDIKIHSYLTSSPDFLHLEWTRLS